MAKARRQGREGRRVLLLAAGCDQAKVKVNVEAKGDNITVNGRRTDRVELKKDESGTTVNGQPVTKVDVKVNDGQVQVKTTPPPTAPAK